MLGKIALGRYRLVRSLGSGSNAEVFLAEPLHGPGEWVVVKRVHDHVVRHPKFRQLFEAEVRSMANFNHPYAVRLVEASANDPIGPCLVMEYVPGITLEELLHRKRALDLHRVGRLLGYFCHALEAAHAAGVIHRDLKPSNLMVQDVGEPTESLKVMDFGFAGFAARPHIQLAELTGRGPIYAIGTPAYVSPEMVRGDPVDSRSDLYSVGVILYELLTGRLPFDYDDQDRMLMAHVKQSPPKFDKIGCKHIPPEVEGVVHLALAKYPNERQQTARDIALMYGEVMGVDYWAETEPVDWEPEATILSTPATDLALNQSSCPFRITHQFVAVMPERLAAAKLRGFVEDVGGQVLASEPGLIRLCVGMPRGYKDSSGQGGSGLFRWLRSVARPAVASGQEPIELELHMQKLDPSQPRLNVVVAFCPMKDFPPKDARNWRNRCDRLHTTLRQYLGA